MRMGFLALLLTACVGAGAGEAKSPDAGGDATSQPAASQPAASQPATSQPATSQPATSQPAEPPYVAQADPQVVDWLDRLEARGKKIKSYQARVVHTEVEELTGNRTTRIGGVAYQAGPPAKFRIDFEKLLIDDAVRDKKMSFVFDGQWLLRIYWDTKVMIRKRIVDPKTKDKKFDPLSVGEGPFPLPLGQKRNDVLRLFAVKLAEPVEKDPANSVHLQLTPRPGAPEAAHRPKLQKIDLWFDREALLPIKVASVNEQGLRVTAKLSHPKVNALDPEQVAELFDTSTRQAGPDWEVEEPPPDPPTSLPQSQPAPAIQP